MELLLFVHILGAVLFLGNIVTAAFWKVHADRTGEGKVMHYATKNLLLADFVFTLPGLILLIVSGVWMVVIAGIPLWSWNWLSFSLLLFGLTGLLWLVFLLPLQRKMIRYSAQMVGDGELKAVQKAYLKASRYWTLFGILATILPFIILYLMIVKRF